MPSPILARADALMQRRHLSGNDNEEVPVLTDAIGVVADSEADDDIPLLLDVAMNKVAALSEPSSSALDFSVAWLNELARRVEQRLLAEIPQLVAATLDELLAERQDGGHLPRD